MKHQNFESLSHHRSKAFSNPSQRIVYSYNNEENTILGHVEEDGNFIWLYEDRGKFFGTEFLISFSKDSSTYKLIQVEDTANWVQPDGDDN